MRPSKKGSQGQISSAGCTWPSQFALPAVAAATAVGSLGLTIEPSVEAQSNGFSGPYEITTPPPSGNWATLADPADAGEPAPTLDTSDAPASVSLAITEDGSSGEEVTFEIGIAAAQAGTVTFSWSTTAGDSDPYGGGEDEANFFTSTGTTLSNGTTTDVQLANGDGDASGTDVTFDVSQGEIFGFLVGAKYTGDETLTISSFSAPVTVPEPDVLAWLATGATGLLLCRELRRRRRPERAVGLPA
jgi:hypothetical protein